MEKVYIVTGGTGFVGNNVIAELEQRGEKVVALVRDYDKSQIVLKDSGAKIVHGNILDTRAIERLFLAAQQLANKQPHKVIFIHTASVVLIGGNRKEYEEMENTNINGIKNVIAACVSNDCRLLYVSSVHAITEPPERALTTEIEVFDPLTVKGKYAKSKAQASALVMKAIDEQGLDAVMVHPAGITGPGDYSNTHLTQMVCDYMQGRIPMATDGGYDFVDVRDVAHGIILAADNGKTRDRFILSNKYYSVKQMLEYLHEATNGKKITKSVPMPIAQISAPFIALAAKLSKSRPLYTSYSLYTLKSNSNFSHQKATDELGYNPRPLRESIFDTVEFLKRRQK